MIYLVQNETFKLKDAIIKIKLVPALSNLTPLLSRELYINQEVKVPGTEE